MLGDQPGVTAATVAALLAGRGDAPLAVCRYDDGRGHPIAFARSVFGELAELHGDRGVWRLLDRHARRGGRGARSPGPIPLDVDTEDDYAAVLRVRREPRHEPARGHRRGGGRGAACSRPTSRRSPGALADGRLPRRRGAGDVDVPQRAPAPAAAARGRGRGRQDRGGQGARGRASTRRSIRLQCYEGIDAAEALYEWNYPRQLLSIRLADARGADAQRGGPVRPRLPDPPAAAAGARAPRPAAGGAPDRRDRPRRRRLRGVPARAARRRQRDDPGDRDDRRHPPADHRAHLQPHARPARRRQAPLPVPVDRLPEPGARGRDRPPPRARAPRRRWPCRSQTPSRACATPTCRSRRGSPRRSTGSRRSSCSASSASTPRRPIAPSARC